MTVAELITKLQEIRNQHTAEVILSDDGSLLEAIEYNDEHKVVLLRFEVGP